MKPTVFCNHYVTDLRFFLHKNYKDIFNSGEYFITKRRFCDRTSQMSYEDKVKFAEQCIMKCLKMHKYAKKIDDEKIMRKCAVVCLSVLDSF